MFVKRSIVLAVFAAAAVVLMAGSAYAWCSPYVDASSNLRVTPTYGFAGVTGVPVTGENWRPDAQVELHWGAVEGPLLGSGTVGRPLSTQSVGGSFSVDVAIPAGAGPGTYQIVAYVTGSVASQRSAAFRVVSAGAAARADGTPVPSGSESSATSGGMTGVDPAAPVPATTADGSTHSMFAVPPSVEPVAPETALPGSGGGAVRTPVVGTPVVGTPAVGTPAVGAPLVGTPGAVGNPRAVGPIGALITAGPLRQSAPGTPGRLSASVPGGGSVPVVDDQGGPIPSARSALGNPWQGFNEGAKAAPHGLGDLTHRSTSLTASVSPLVLPPLAMLALFGGFGVAELRRRRVTATAAS